MPEVGGSNGIQDERENVVYDSRKVFVVLRRLSERVFRRSFRTRISVVSMSS